MSDCGTDICTSVEARSARQFTVIFLPANCSA
jgi:hypothetical protein